MNSDEQKRHAAARALEFVEDGMRLGLGTGSTAAHFVSLLGEQVANGLKVSAVPTSNVTAELARAAGIPLTDLDTVRVLDLTVDGADEIDTELRLIKGGGGALLREKIVATASEQMIVIADESKLVESLGSFALPVEVVPFGLGATQVMIELLAADAGCEGAVSLRKTPSGDVFTTDGGHYILDCAFGEIPEPEVLEDALKMVPGVVETGLFIGIADLAVIAGPRGVQEIANEELVYHDDDATH